MMSRQDAAGESHATVCVLLRHVEESDYNFETAREEILKKYPRSDRDYEMLC